MWHRALMTDRDDNICLQSDYTGSALVQVFDLAVTNAAIYSNTRTIAAVLTNTVQTWDVNPSGYNLEVTVTSNQVSREGGHTYRTCVYIQHSEEGLHCEIFEVTVEPALGV